MQNTQYWYYSEQLCNFVADTGQNRIMFRNFIDRLGHYAENSLFLQSIGIDYYLQITSSAVLIFLMSPTVDEFRPFFQNISVIDETEENSDKAQIRITVLTFDNQTLSSLLKV